MKSASRALAVLLVLTLAAPLAAPPTLAADADAALPPAAPSGEEVKPKFIWGVLLNVAFKLAMAAFGDWLAERLSGDLKNVSEFEQILLASAQIGVVTLGDFSPFGEKGVAAAENTVVGKATKPIDVANGRENYQGAHVAIVAFDRAGKPAGIQPVAATFRTGDRIKVKVLPTFDALAVIENITPTGQRLQIYPPRRGEAVALKAGSEVFLPLRRDDYFEFAGATGDEQLVITLRDPRAVNGAASTVAVSRKDEAKGSSFVQETPNGSYPVIAQAITLRHQTAPR